MESEGLVMYRLKPVFELDKEITVPTNMYKMRNLYSECIINCSHNTPTNDKDEYDLEKIKKRQEVLLQKLAEIKKILATLKDELAAPKIDIVGSESCSEMCTKPNFSDFGITYDVVLNVNVARQYPPYSLLVINKIWPEISIKYSWHLHSSAPSLPPVFKQFQEKLDNKVIDQVPDLNITVVWKIAEIDCEFVISPIKSIPLIGEVNFLRFLSASLSNKTDDLMQTMIDEKLDACYCLSHINNNNNNDDMKPFLQILSNGLENCHWLCGKNVTIVDVAAWSVIKQMKKHNLGLQSLNNWYKNCNKYFDV